jgi:hypothetical protein
VRADNEALRQDVAQLNAAVRDTLASTPRPPPDPSSVARCTPPPAVSVPPAAPASANASKDAASASKEAGAAVAPTPEQRAATQAAGQVLDEALARGRLSREDVLAMRSDLRQADVEAIRELHRTIAVAVNTRKLVPEDPRFVFP